MITISEHTLDESLLKDKDLKIIDLGACLGEFSSEVNEKFKIQQSILVEANPTNFCKIKKQDNFILLNQAIVHNAEQEYVSFNEDESSPYNGSIVFDYFSESMKVHKIQTTTLKKLVNMMDLQPNELIDILKIDIEGGEYDLLLNAEEKDLKKFKQLTIEFHDFVNPNLRIINSIIINKLTSMGFSLISSKPAHFRYGSDHYDVLLINDQK
jgi:FkbM family methyltransferase